MNVYISGPMTGHTDLNFPMFHDTANELRRLGFAVNNPADLGIRPDWEHKDYLRHDVRNLTYCDAILMLPGWAESRGATFERDVAIGLELPVFYDLNELKGHKDAR